MDTKHAIIGAIIWIIACSWIGAFALVPIASAWFAWAPGMLGALLISGVQLHAAERRVLDRSVLRWATAGWFAEAICLLAVLGYYALVAWGIVRPVGETVSS